MLIGRIGLMASCLVFAIGSVGCLPLFCIACDGVLRAEGEVYAWIDAPVAAVSAAEVDIATSGRQMNLEPVVAAEVVLEPWTPKRRPSGDTLALWTSRTTTDGEGRFRLGGTTRPGSFDVTLTVRALGFQPVEHVFRHGRQMPHKVRVVMVRVK